MNNTQKKIITVWIIASIFLGYKVAEGSNPVPYPTFGDYALITPVFALIMLVVLGIPSLVLYIVWRDKGKPEGQL